MFDHQCRWSVVSFVAHKNRPTVACEQGMLVVDVRIKDFDGAREVELEVKGGSVFAWGHGFSYEFDLGIFRHAMNRLFTQTTEKDSA